MKKNFLLSLFLMFHVVIDAQINSKKIEDNKWKFSPPALKLLAEKKQIPEKYILSSDNIDELKASLTLFSKEIKILTTDKASNSIVIITTNRFLVDSLLSKKRNHFY